MEREEELRKSILAKWGAFLWMSKGKPCYKCMFSIRQENLYRWRRSQTYTLKPLDYLEHMPCSPYPRGDHCLLNENDAILQSSIYFALSFGSLFCLCIIVEIMSKTKVISPPQSKNCVQITMLLISPKLSMLMCTLDWSQTNKSFL
jgi:hypothetical protein